MKIVQINKRDSIMIQKLLDVWESSVKATHLFLSVDEINNIKQYVPQALKDVSILVIAENKNGNPVGFMGVDDKRLETVYINQNVLMAECNEPEHSSYIDVAQIGKDGVILSESEGYVYHPKNPDEYS